MALKNKQRIKDLRSKQSKDGKMIALLGHANALAKQFELIAVEEKKLKTAKDKLKKELKDIVTKHSDTYKDDKGSLFLPVGDGMSLKQEMRLSVLLDQEKAVTYAENMNLTSELTHTEVIADMSSFEQLYLNGSIEDAVMNSLVTKKESFAFKIVKNK